MAIAGSIRSVDKHAADTAVVEAEGKIAPGLRSVNAGNWEPSPLRLNTLFGRGPEERSARDLYIAVVEQARQPWFYRGIGVPDTLDGRFEMIVLHAYIVVNRLRGIGDAGGRVAQSLFDQMFADMDRNLREIGVGDLSVGKQVKAMAKRFYGSVNAYGQGLEAADGGVLGAAIARNVYGRITPPDGAAEALSGYLRREVAAAALIGDDELLAGQIRFGAPPGRAD